MEEKMKTKRPYAQVKHIADQLQAALAPACLRIEQAGSLRRMKSVIGDIELVAVPILERNLLGEPTGVSAVDRQLATWPITLTKNGNKWKQFLFVTKGGDAYQVDLFLQPAPKTWGVNFMIRTGPFGFSKKMVTQKYKGGYVPDDLYVLDGRVWRRGVSEPLDTPEEEDVFKLWGMGFVPPEERK